MEIRSPAAQAGERMHLPTSKTPLRIRSGQIVGVPETCSHLTRCGPLNQIVSAAGRSTRPEETVLLVEDEPAMLDLATRMLRKQGYLVLPEEAT